MPRAIQEVKERMLSAWNDVEVLVAEAIKKTYRGMPPSSPNSPRFLEPSDVQISPYHYRAWWQAPERWRYDREIRGRDVDERMTLSFVVDRETWAIRRNGELRRQGSRPAAEDEQLTKGEGLWYGRPYLTARDNAHLWAWLNPQLWASSCSFVINDTVAPLPDDVYHDTNVVHLLAINGAWEHDPFPDRLSDQQRMHWLDDPERDAEIGDYVNFFQLWVDMKTGFLRRVTGEGANGRQWDIIVESLLTNGAARVPPGTFSL